jgi:hypothetical protein
VRLRSQAVAVNDRALLSCGDPASVLAPVGAGIWSDQNANAIARREAPGRRKGSSGAVVADVCLWAIGAGLACLRCWVLPVVFDFFR